MRDVPSVPKETDLSPLVQKSQPFKVTGYTARDLGKCLEEWTPDRLRSVLKDCRVSVHVSRKACLNFVHKNFEYEYMSIGEMFDRMELSQTDDFPLPEYLYFRSLGARPRKDRATLASVHPYLEETFRLPKNIAAFLDESRTHSTVFRISQAGLELWTHYDALDVFCPHPQNFLFQVHGAKVVMLFPPSALHKLAITDTSSPYHPPMNTGNRDLLAAYDDAVLATLSPGEALFIPAAWSHGVLSLHSRGICGHNADEDAGIDACVSVNQFFTSDGVTYLSKNIYGNEDPAPMKRACEMLQGDVSRLAQQLPPSLQRALWSKLAAIALHNLNQV